VISAETVKTDRPIRVKLEERFADTFILRDGQWKVVGKYYFLVAAHRNLRRFHQQDAEQRIGFFCDCPGRRRCPLDSVWQADRELSGIGAVGWQRVNPCVVSPAIGVFEDSLDSTPVSFASIGPIARYLPST
jgi:hypothetical protein